MCHFTLASSVKDSLNLLSWVCKNRCFCSVSLAIHYILHPTEPRTEEESGIKDPPVSANFGKNNGIHNVWASCPEEDINPDPTVG